jgi:protein-S-isoprenylcysteine O-methyltransferase Ste14
MLRALSLGALLLMALAMTGLWLRGALFSAAPVVVAAQCAAVALMVWARLTLGWRRFHAAATPTVGGLVTTGPYRFIRHPIYTAACWFGWAGVLANGSVASVLLGGLLVGGALVRMLCEERLVAAVYPEYRQYARTTKRMLPYVF